MRICEDAPNLDKFLSGLISVKIRYSSKHLQETTLDNRMKYLVLLKTLV